MTEELPPVAWEVEIRGFVCYAFTTTKAKAQWLATKNYWDAYGRRKGEWPRASAARAPRWDKSFRNADGWRHRCWAEDQL